MSAVSPRTALASTLLALTAAAASSAPAHASPSPADRTTPRHVAAAAARAVNHDHPRVAVRWATHAAVERMYELREQGFRFRVRECRHHGHRWVCQVAMPTVSDPEPHQAATFVVRRTGGGLRVVAVGGLD